MSAEQVGDGNLPGAIVDLQRAIHQLIDPRTEYINNEVRQGPSLYMQLWDATPGEQISGRRVTESTAPSWIDALNLRIEIDTRIEITQPQPVGVPPTVGRLKVIAKKAWKPEEVRYITLLTTALEEWAKEIDALINPTPKWTLPAPCPACGVAIVYKKDSSGERVRQPALQIGPQGCFCANTQCDGHWSPDKFMFLSKLLGYEMPEGVLE